MVRVGIRQIILFCCVCSGALHDHCHREHVNESCERGDYLVSTDHLSLVDARVALPTGTRYCLRTMILCCE